MLPGFNLTVPSIPPPEFVAFAEALGSVPGTNITLGTPAGTQDGDLMVAVIQNGFGDTTSISSPGWTADTSQGASNYGIHVAHRIASSEPGSRSFTLSNGYYSGVLLTYRNASLVDAVGAFQLNSSASSITLSAPGVLLGCFASAVGSRALTYPAGMIERASADYTASGIIKVGEANPQPAGPTGTKTPSWSGSGNTYCLLVAVR